MQSSIINNRDSEIRNPLQEIMPGFNGTGKINLGAYKDHTLLNLLQGKFIKYEFLDLEKIDLAIQDMNIGTRDEKSCEEEARIKDLRSSFTSKNWDSTAFPPVVDTDGNVRDGRGRMKAAKANGERWIPVALYSFDDDSIRTKVSNGLRANNVGLPQTLSAYGDFLGAGRSLIKLGELKRKKSSIDEWLANEAGVASRIDNRVCGQVTKLSKAIFEASDEGGIIRTQTKNDWIAFCKKATGEDDIYLLSVDNLTAYPQRFFAKILEECDKDHKIVLYTTGKQTSEKDFKRACGDTLALLNDLWTGCFEVVNSVMSGVEIQPPDGDYPWEVLGVCPQVYGKHDRLVKNYKLAKIKEVLSK